MSTTLYDQDFYAWANQQAWLLRDGKLAQADIEHIAEEIESMGNAERRELESRLAVVLMHLLKWQFQPERRGKSSRLTIIEQRRRLQRHLTAVPGLRANLPTVTTDAYGDAVIAAAWETEFDPEAFPAACPWSFEQIMNPDFWPSTGLS